MVALVVPPLLLPEPLLLDELPEELLDELLLEELLDELLEEPDELLDELDELLLEELDELLDELDELLDELDELLLSAPLELPLEEPLLVEFPPLLELLPTTPEELALLDVEPLSFAEPPSSERPASGLLAEPSSPDALPGP